MVARTYERKITITEQNFVSFGTCVGKPLGDRLKPFHKEQSEAWDATLVNIPANADYFLFETTRDGLTECGEPVFLNSKQSVTYIGTIFSEEQIRQNFSGERKLMNYLDKYHCSMVRTRSGAWVPYDPSHFISADSLK